MCGFVGFLNTGLLLSDNLAPTILTRMANAISSRGPDSAGFWHDSVSGIALGHRRLAVVDLSPSGSQPMHSACGRFVLAFNGEIYNHVSLRSDLPDWSWFGHSDTESLLAGFTAWGVSATIQRCVGMFALAVWDKQTRTLILARDRLGEKPLYYGWQGQGNDASFLFGSDLAALRVHPSFEGSVNRDGLALYFRHNTIAAPHSIFQGIYKLNPGSILTVSLESREPTISSYWSLPQVAERGVAHPFIGSEADAIDRLDLLLQASVRQQMVADVPLGAFLSGGIDSSTVVALMQQQACRRVQTFTIGFEEQAFNEANHAKSIAKHLGTEHVELYVSAQQALDVIPRLPSLYSEPFF